MNTAELGRAFGATHHTIAHYVDILSATFMVRALQPWFENISKRQVRAPKIYLRDTGLLHALTDVKSRAALDRNPRAGASWEGFALEQVIRELALGAGDAYFWATHAHAELDLLAFVDGRRFGFELKRADAPTVTKSMRIAAADLKLEHLFAVYPGAGAFALDDGITALGIGSLGELARRVGRRETRRARGPS